MRSMDQLQALLCEGDRELVNIKFFPGSDRGLTSEQLAEAARDIITHALAAEVDAPPSTGLEAMDLAIALVS